MLQQQEGQSLKSQELPEFNLANDNKTPVDGNKSQGLRLGNKGRTPPYGSPAIRGGEDLGLFSLSPTSMKKSDGREPIEFTNLKDKEARREMREGEEGGEDFGSGEKSIWENRPGAGTGKIPIGALDEEKMIKIGNLGKFDGQNDGNPRLSDTRASSFGNEDASNPDVRSKPRAVHDNPSVGEVTNYQLYEGNNELISIETSEEARFKSLKNVSETYSQHVDDFNHTKDPNQYHYENINDRAFGSNSNSNQGTFDKNLSGPNAFKKIKGQEKTQTTNFNYEDPNYRSTNSEMLLSDCNKDSLLAKNENFTGDSYSNVDADQIYKHSVSNTDMVKIDGENGHSDYHHDGRGLGGLGNEYLESDQIFLIEQTDNFNKLVHQKVTDHLAAENLRIPFKGKTDMIQKVFYFIF
jgi:hypothetical protein